MGNNQTKLLIEDVKLIKITKIKPWAINFNYDNKHYLLHTSEDEDCYITLYERELNDKGYWKLNHICSRISCVSIMSFIRYNYNTTYKCSAPYSHINKRYFVYKLVQNNLLVDTYDKKIKERIEALHNIDVEIQKKNEELSNLKIYRENININIEF